MTPLGAKAWSPWLVGAGIGILSWFSFASADKPIGITGPFESAAAIVTRAAAPSTAAANPYYSEPEKPLRIGWEAMLVVGVFIGAFFSSKLSGDRGATLVPALWRERFGSRPATRLVGAFVGGAVLMLGARIAGGCTSGHGISGTLQLAVSSWIFITLAFGTAVAAAFLLYGGRSRV